MSPGPVRWLSQLRLRRPRPEDSVAWEIEHHLAEVADRLVAEGWDPAEAAAEARRRFGDTARYEPSMRRMEEGRVAMERRVAGWDFVRQGVAGVVRTARRYPGFTAGVVATLALGIGANATMYGVVDRLLLQPPAHIANPDQVRLIYHERPSPITGETFTQAGLTYPDYVDLKAHSGMRVAAYAGTRPETVGSGEGATRARVALATAEFFELLGVQPAIGRFYDRDEAQPGAQLTAVLSHEYWESAYGADPGVLGRTIELAGRTHTVVGVAPKGFTGVHIGPVDVWAPQEATHVVSSFGGGCLENRGCWWMSAVARLADGVTVEAAEAEATALHLNGRREQIEADGWSEDARFLLGSVIAADGPTESDEASVVRWLAGVSAIVLLIACANVANLFLARGTRQRKEVAVRLALGVPRVRLVGQMVLEAVLLALVGGGVAILIARWGGDFVRSALLPGVYFPDSAVNGRVLGFTVLASVLAGLMAGLGPALQGSRADVTANLGDAARGSSAVRSRLRGTLTVLQAALSVVLLVGAGLFIRSLGELRGLDLGVDTDRLVLAELEFRTSDLDGTEQDRLYEEAISMVEALPGVASATATAVPWGWAFGSSIRVPHLDSIPRLPGGGPYYHAVRPGYFETVGLDIVRGRSLGPEDGPDAMRVVVVSETMARTVWDDRDALGECLLIGRDEDVPCTTVVGVVQEAARQGFDERPAMVYYVPLAQHRQSARGLYIRAAGDVEATVGDVAPVLRAFSPEIRFANVRTLQTVLDPQARSWELGATMFSVFGLLALALAAIGLYSVLAFDVAQRTRELGIRTALGARRDRLLAGVMLSGGRLAVFGVLGGMAVAYLAAPSASDLLFQVSPRDPLVLGGVAAVLIAVGGVASVVPGIRATRVDPVISLQSE